MGRVILSGASKGMTVPMSYPKNFADATWAQIIEACQQNRVPDSWVVGSQKTMTINGVAYTIDIIGKGHDDYADGSGKAPLTFQMHDCYGTTYPMNSSNTNRGGWTSCAMRQTHLPAILALMPTEIQSGIKEVNKLTSGGGMVKTITTTADKLFPLSEIEIFGTYINSVDGEGMQYDYYRAGNSKVKNRNGNVVVWPLRSPVSINTTSFCAIDTNGDHSIIGPTSYNSVSFAFCF